MIKNIAISLYIFFYATICGCGKDRRQSDFEKLKPSYKIRKIGKIPFQIPESSGLVLARDETLWTINDGGNSNELFRITFEGKIVERVTIHGTRNIDWEDLAKDDKGHIYIGDIGNNANTRRELTIYKVREADMVLLGEITFSYPDQSSFPPPDEKKNFDCEGLIWSDNNLYLFSKDWSKTKTSKFYRVPDQPGTYSAELLDSLKMKTWITAADNNPNDSLTVLLGYGKIFLFNTGTDPDLYNSRKFCIPFRRSAQAEAIVFINNTSFIISNEQGKLFMARQKK